MAILVRSILYNCSISQLRAALQRLDNRWGSKGWLSSSGDRLVIGEYPYVNMAYRNTSSQTESLKLVGMLDWKDDNELEKAKKPDVRRPTTRASWIVLRWRSTSMRPEYYPTEGLYTAAIEAYEERDDYTRVDFLDAYDPDDPRKDYLPIGQSFEEFATMVAKELGFKEYREMEDTPSPTMDANKSAPTAFISYSWDSDEHKKWVHDLALRLRSDGVAVTLDQWDVVPGDQLPHFMEEAVRGSSYVLIICTPRYKDRSDQREGGVGYEGDIITAEVMNTRNQRKFIPILREGAWQDAAPSWLSGKVYVDLSGIPYTEPHYQDLLTTVLGTRMTAPPVGQKSVAASKASKGSDSATANRKGDFTPIEITGVIIDEVGEPRNDGTPASALYRVPFRLSRQPPSAWATIFVQAWDHPQRFTTMHRPGIASVIHDTVVLDGTTVEEVEKYHRDTLMLATNEANQKYIEYLEKKRTEEERKQKSDAEHKKNVEDIAQRLFFDETDDSG